MISIFILFGIFLGTVKSQAIGKTHFFVQEGHEKCFVEDVALNTHLTVIYKNYDNPGVVCSIIFKDPRSRPVFNREVTHEKAEGKVTYVAKIQGEHQICISCEGSQWFNSQQLKWSLSIDMGDSEINLADIAKTHHTEDLAAVLELVKGRFTQIIAENDYERLQEERFRKTSEAMNARVVMIAGIQLGVMIITTVISISHLSHYFHTQKLY